MRGFTLLSLIILLVFNESDAQRRYSLTEIIQITRTQSPAWLRAETRKENNYWQYKTYLSNYNPQLGLEGTLPSYQRSFIPVTQPDGQIVYREVNNNTVEANLALSQSIGKTGGRLFASSSLARFDNFIPGDENTQWNGNPVQVGFLQPIFQFNQLNWDRKIQPLVYEESQKGYFEELEDISVRATQAYFDLLLAQVNYQVASTNVANNDTIYTIAQGRFQLGKIGENELLQLELNLVNSQLAVAQADVDLQTAQLNLKSFVGLPNETDIDLIIPEDIPKFNVDENVALSEARKNRQDPVSYERRILQGKQGVAQAKGENGVNMDLFASYGLSGASGQAAGIGEVYSGTVSSTRVNLQMNIPIIDWGRQKSRRKTAEANLKLIEYQVAQDQINFDQEVLIQVRNFELLREQVKARKKSDEIAQNAYNISYQLYLIGKISITDLNQSLASKDLAKQNYIRSLRDFWTAYFLLRQRTLYDFENDELLTRDLQDSYK